MIANVVAYATGDNHGQYLNQLRAMEKACSKFGMPFYGRELPRFNDAIEAILYKATLIDDMLKDLNSPLLYLDADSEVLGRVDIPEDGEWDIGITRGFSARPFRLGAATAAVMAFRPTPSAKELLKVWKHLCQNRSLSGYCDHRRFYAAHILVKEPINILNLFPSLMGNLRINPHKGNKCIDFTASFTGDEVTRMSMPLKKGLGL